MTERKQREAEFRGSSAEFKGEYKIRKTQQSNRRKRERERKEKGREGPGVERRKRILLRTSRPTPSECIALTSSY